VCGGAEAPPFQFLTGHDSSLPNSSNPDEFKLRVAGVRSTTDVARDEMERASEVERFAER
jgi:hypothetical protein